MVVAERLYGFKEDDGRTQEVEQVKMKRVR
jgi:hypothetical protein